MKIKFILLALTFGLVTGGTIIPAAAADGVTVLQGNQVSFGGSVTVAKGETTHDAFAFGGNVTVDGTVTNDVVAFGGNVVISGRVDHDVVALGGNVALGPESRVGHNVTLLGGRLERAEGAVVGGQVVTQRDRAFNGPFFVPSVGVHRFGWFGAITALGILLLGLVLLLFLPRQLQTAGEVLEHRPLESFAVGCGATIAALFLSVLLLITIVLPSLIATAMALAWLFGWAAIFIVTGQRLLQQVRRPQDLALALIVGGVLWGILANLPVIQVLVILVGGSVAVGAALLSRFGTQGPGAPLFGTAQPPAAPAPTQPGA